MVFLPHNHQICLLVDFCCWTSVAVVFPEFPSDDAVCGLFGYLRTLCSGSRQKCCTERSKKQGSSYVQISVFRSDPVFKNLPFLGGPVFLNTKPLQLQIETQLMHPGCS